jgi:hypothetical protein
MQEVRTSSGTCQRSDDLLADQARLADPGDDDRPRRRSNRADGVAETRVQAVRQSPERIGFLANDSPGFSQLFHVAKRNDVA